MRVPETDAELSGIAIFGMAALAMLLAGAVYRVPACLRPTIQGVPASSGVN